MGKVLKAAQSAKNWNKHLDYMHWKLDNSSSKTDYEAWKRGVSDAWTTNGEILKSELNKIG